jgi:hypothetical protein
MTNWILPPRLLAWPKTLEQRYNSQRTVGLVSGSSFTSGTNQITLAASWPGYLYDYTFFNDQFDDDRYHPDIHTRLSWTDRVLLPELVKLGIIQSN